MNIEFMRSEIIGALRPLRIPARFSDAPVVVRLGAGIFSVEEFMDEPSELAVGTHIPDRDWDHLLRTDEAFLLQRPVATMRYARCWIFRDWDRNELASWLDELRSINAVVDREEQSVIALCVDEFRAAKVREQWTRTLFDEAWACASEGRLVEAIKLAEVVWQMDLYRNQDSTLLYCAVLEKAQRMAEARDLLYLEANTTGKPLAELESILLTYVGKLGNISQQPNKRRRYFSDPGSPSFSVPST